MLFTLLTILGFVFITLGTFLPSVRGKKPENLQTNLSNRINYFLRKNKKTITILGGIIGVICTLYSNRDQDENQALLKAKSDTIRLNVEKSDTRIKHIIDLDKLRLNQQKALTDSTGKIASLYKELSIIQKKLIDKSEEIIIENKKSLLPLHTSAVIHFTVEFDVKENNLQNFEALTLKYMNYKSGSYYVYSPGQWRLISDTLINDYKNNPLSVFNAIRLNIGFYNKQNIETYNLSKDFFVGFLTRNESLNMIKKIQEKFDNYIDMTEGNQIYDFDNPLLTISYSPVLRKFRLNCVAKRIPAHLLMNYRSLYDIDNSTAKITLLPQTLDSSKILSYKFIKLTINMTDLHLFKFSNLKRVNSKRSQFLFHFESNISLKKNSYEDLETEEVQMYNN